MTLAEAKFTARNGDTLPYLTTLKLDIDKRLSVMQEKRKNVDEVLQAIIKSETKLMEERLRIDMRTQVWWLEFRLSNKPNQKNEY